MTLNELRPGDQARVVRIEGSGPVKRRIMDMGVTRGCQLKVMKLAPLGDPMEITVRGYELTLRKNECQCIQVEKTA